MTLQIDDNFLNELGLSNMSSEQKSVFVQQLLVTLESRVGERLSEGLTDQQLDDFERISESEDAGEAVESWVKSNNPNYETIVSEEMQKLKDDIRTNMNIVMDNSAA